MKKLNVFEYHDYRKLLLGLIQERKRLKKTFSYRWFSQRAGFNSPNILNLVVKGKRHLSLESAEKVIEIFNLKKEEGIYFKNLLQFEKAKTLSEKEYFAKEIIKLKKYQNQFPLSAIQLDYYEQWFNIPVRELFSLINPPQDSLAISECLIPSVSPSEIDHSLDALKKLGLIVSTQQGFNQAQSSITTGNKFANYSVVGFHKKMMQLGSEALDRFSSSEREISSVTIGLSEEKFKVIQKMIEDFRNQLMLISEEDSQKERVYQLNFQLFPLTRKRDVK